MNTKTSFILSALCTILICAGVYWICEIQYQTRCSKLGSESTSTDIDISSEPALERITLTNTLSAVDTIILGQRLSQLHTAGQPSVREAFFCFQGFLDAGTNALLAIRSYMESGHNVLLAGNRWSSLDPLPYWSRDTNLFLPASTRMGLVEVLKTMGTPETTELLLQVLPTSLNAFEVVSISRTLLAIDPVLFSDQIRTIARRMLSNTRNQKDREQLLKLLAKVGDIELANELAENLIVKGQLDQAVLEFLATVLKEDSVPYLEAAYNHTDISSNDRKQILEKVMDYVGLNSTANNIFLAELDALGNNNPKKKALIRELTAEGSGSLGMAHTNPETGKVEFQRRSFTKAKITPELATARLELLDRIRADGDESITPVLDIEEQKLKTKADPNASPSENTAFPIPEIGEPSPYFF